MMYVYFDGSGEIKSISPDPSAAISATYRAIMVPVSDVEGFLLGKKNPFNYFIKGIERLGTTTYTITRKEPPNAFRNVDNFLTEIGSVARSDDANILIENYINDKVLKISINTVIKDLLVEGTDAEINRLSILLDAPAIYLFFTKKKDPYYLIDTVSVSPKAIFDTDILHIDYTANLSNVSVFTKKLLNGYAYIER